MNATPVLFDHAVTSVRAKRRMRLGDGVDFLFTRSADDLLDRLQPILRSFPLILDLGTANDAFYKQLEAIRPESRIIRAAPISGGSRTDSLVCHIEVQPFGADIFDLITSGLALQHANDLPGALVQIRRALKPDGLFIGCLAGGATLTELRQSFAEAESEITGGISPRVFPFADVRDMGGLLQRAGFTLPVTDSESITVRYGDMFSLMADLRAMGATNSLTERSRKFTSRSIMLKAAEVYQRRFADPDGRIRATFEIIWLTGWAPHESQQKPLKPGSAKQRLADALGVSEYTAGDKPGP
jgi:SAM-dependent methyltransferase